MKFIQKCRVINTNLYHWQENCIRTICQTILSNFKLYAGDKTNCDRKRIFGVGVAITTAVHPTLPSIEGDLDLYRWYVLKSKNYHGFHVFHSMWCYLGLFKLHVACEGLCTWEHWLHWFINPIIVLDHNVF